MISRTLATSSASASYTQYTQLLMKHCLHLGRYARRERLVKHLAVQTKPCISIFQKCWYHVESRLGAIAGDVERIIGECHVRSGQGNLLTQGNTPEKKDCVSNTGCLV